MSLMEEFHSEMLCAVNLFDALSKHQAPRTFTAEQQVGGCCSCGSVWAGLWGPGHTRLLFPLK